MAIQEAAVIHQDAADMEQATPAFPIRRLVGAGALVLACGGIAGGVAEAAWSAFTPTGIELGPHEATAQLTLDGKETVDLGPLGSADHLSGWTMNTGVKVVVKGIPVPPNQSAISNISTMANEYKALLADPEHIKNNAIHTVESRVWHDGVEGGILGGITGLGAWALLQAKRRRRETALASFKASLSDEQSLAWDRLQATERHHPVLRRGAVVGSMLLVAVACGGEFVLANPVNPAVDHTLDGTPFQGFAINGELLRLAVDEGGSRIKDFIETDQKFYNMAKSNFDTSFQTKFGDTPPSHDGLVYILSISDNHCNIGMDRVHGAIANAFNVDGVIDSGDLAMSGTAAEEECVAAELDATKAKNRVFDFAAGNHDSPTTEDQVDKYKGTVLHMGSTASIKGFRILGEDDVNESVFGQTIHLRGSETVQQETDKLTAVACALKPDILVVHEPEMATPAVEKGCVPFSISGHTHKFNPPQLLNTETGSYQFIEGTSGGKKNNSISVGVLLQDAIDTVLVGDVHTKRIVGYYKVTVHPDGKSDISDFTPLSTTPGQGYGTIPGGN